MMAAALNEGYIKLNANSLFNPKIKTGKKARYYTITKAVDGDALAKADATQNWGEAYTKFDAMVVNQEEKNAGALVHTDGTLKRKSYNNKGGLKN